MVEMDKREDVCEKKEENVDERNDESPDDWIDILGSGALKKKVNVN